MAIFFLTAVLILGLRSVSAQDEPPPEPPSYYIIVNPQNPAVSLTRAEVSRYLLKKAVRWNGWRGRGEDVLARPIDQVFDSPIRQEVSRDVHKRSAALIHRYWQVQIFSGRDIPPPEVGSDAAVVAFVRSRPGAIGYIARAALTDEVKVLTVTE